MKVAFFIVTEGRGHMSQALAMADVLEANGDEIVAVISDKTERPIPEYFSKRFEGKIHQLKTFGLIYKEGKRLSIFLTLKDIIKKFPLIFKYSKNIEKIMEETKPDIIINFYSLLLSIYQLFSKKKIPSITVGNHFLLTHKNFLKLEKKGKSFFTIQTMKTFNDLIGITTNRFWALSFSKKFENIKSKKMRVVPPLIRKSVFDLEHKKGDYIFVYLMNSGYMEDVISWHKKNPDIKIHCFTDSKKIDKFWRYDKNLIFHYLHEKKFLILMANARAVVTSGGFETFCESMFFEKPTMLIPTEGQFEQAFRSKIADSMGIALCSKKYDLDKILNFSSSKEVKKDLTEFREWVKEGPRIFLEEIQSLLQNSNKQNLLK